jgi:hypothetical protein
MRSKKIPIPLTALQPWSADQWFHEGSRLRVGSGIFEWTEAEWQPLTATPLADADHVVIEAVVSGKAGAAGVSFGAFKDFLVMPDGGRGLLLQLEIDRGTSWRFRVEGVLQQAQWWNSAIDCVDDLWNQPLLLKTRCPADVFFGDVGIYRLASAPRLSIIVICYHYAQRLRASLANWCRQDVEPGAYEMLVVNPGSTDGTHDVIAAAAAGFPTVRVGELATDAAHWRNKGVAINRAAHWVRGDWVLLTDADCLFHPETVRRILQLADSGKRTVHYGERRHLTRRTSQAVMAGAVDAFGAFGDLANSDGVGQIDRSPWGYAQLIPRDVLQSVRYREDVDHFAHTDEFFVAACRRQGMEPRFFDGLLCLHLEHPFSWYGTDQFL